MSTKIRALGTYRNKKKLPNGIVRRGQTVEVSDSYAEELIEGGKAERVTEPETTGQSDTSDTPDEPEGDEPEEEAPDSEETEEPESSEAPDAEDEGGEEWRKRDLPEDTPFRPTLKDAEVHTLGDVQHMIGNGTLSNIKGLGSARVKKIGAFLKEFVSEQG